MACGSALPNLLKRLVMLELLGSICHALVFITPTGGQLTTPELQEWMVYNQTALAMSAFGLEPVRAAIVAAYYTSTMSTCSTIAFGEINH